MSTPIPFWTPRSKTEAVRRALAERRARLRLRVAAGARADHPAVPGAGNLVEGATGPARKGA